MSELQRSQSDRDDFEPDSSWTIRRRPARLVVDGQEYDLTDAQFNAIRGHVISVLDADAGVSHTKAEISAAIPTAAAGRVMMEENE